MSSEYLFDVDDFMNLLQEVVPETSGDAPNNTNLVMAIPQQPVMMNNIPTGLFLRSTRIRSSHALEQYTNIADLKEPLMKQPYKYYVRISFALNAVPEKLVFELVQSKTDSIVPNGVVVHVGGPVNDGQVWDGQISFTVHTYRRCKCYLLVNGVCVSPYFDIRARRDKNE